MDSRTARAVVGRHGVTSCTRLRRSDDRRVHALGDLVGRDDLDIGQADLLQPWRNSRNDSAPAMQPTYEPRSARCSGGQQVVRDDVADAHPPAGPEHAGDLARRRPACPRRG